MKPLEQVCLEIQKDYAVTHSWRKTAVHFDTYSTMARLIANGYDPGKKIRKRLNIMDKATVVVMGGVVPDGTQAHSASRCPCGQWYISNHPMRSHCFVCSPYRGKRSLR